MSDIIDISIAHNNARLDGPGTRGFLDDGPGNATLEIYGTTKPSPGDAPGGDPLVTIVLANPCGSLVSNKLELEQDSPTGDMVLISGTAVWGRLVNADGVWAGDGTVTLEAGDGAFKIAGDSLALYAGGYVVLGTATLE